MEPEITAGEILHIPASEGAFQRASGHRKLRIKKEGGEQVAAVTKRGWCLNDILDLNRKVQDSPHSTAFFFKEEKGDLIWDPAKERDTINVSGRSLLGRAVS